MPTGSSAPSMVKHPNKSALTHPPFRTDLSNSPGYHTATGCSTRRWRRDNNSPGTADNNPGGGEYRRNERNVSLANY